MRPGDRLQRLDGGETVVTSATQRPGRHTVYNLEVHREHVYHVASSGVLVHNGGPSLPILKDCDVAAEIAKWASTGFSSFDEFKRAVGAAGNNQAWHHIVEQTINSGKFAPQLLQNPANLLALPHGRGSIQSKLSAFYSSKQPFTGGLTVRQWLRKKSFMDQFEFGIQKIKDFGGSQYLPPEWR